LLNRKVDLIRAILESERQEQKTQTSRTGKDEGISVAADDTVLSESVVTSKVDIAVVNKPLQVQALL